MKRLNSSLQRPGPARTGRSSGIVNGCHHTKRTNCPGGTPARWPCGARNQQDQTRATRIVTSPVGEKVPRKGISIVKDIVVFSGSAHPTLAHQICDRLGTRLCPTRISRFSNDCLQAQLTVNVRQRDVYIIQPLVPPTQENLMELLLMIDAARGASAAQITAVMPHYAYARSDKKDASRISLGGRLVADMLVSAGASRVLTMALHSPQVQGFFRCPTDQLTALGALAEHFRGTDLSNTVVVSPDLGNAKNATQFARLLGIQMAAGSKRRLADDKVIVDSIVGDVTGKRAIVLDDEIATGGSIVEICNRLKDFGALCASVACTHGLFTGQAVEKLRACEFITDVASTDTVPAPKNFPELTTISVAPLFAEAIERIHHGRSVSKMFEDVDPVFAPPKPVNGLF